MTITLIQLYKIHSDNSNEYQKTIPFASRKKAIEYLMTIENYQQCVDMQNMENYWRSDSKKMIARIEEVKVIQ